MTGTNAITYQRGNEFYMFSWSDEQADEMANTLGRFASNPDLAFTWYDASVIGERVRQREQLAQLIDRLPLEDEFGEW